MSTPVWAEVTMAVAMPVAKACATSACCTCTGLAPTRPAKRVVMALKVRKRLPRNWSMPVNGAWV